MKHFVIFNNLKCPKLLFANKRLITIVDLLGHPPNEFLPQPHI
jgi:hypothetical protein